MIESERAACQPLLCALRAQDPGGRAQKKMDATERALHSERPRELDGTDRVPPARKRPYSWVVFFRDFSIFAQVSLRVMVRLKTGIPDLTVSGSTQK